MSRDKREVSPESEEEGTEGRKIFVGGLSLDVTESDLFKAFEKYGVVRAQIQYDAYSRRSRGFGFVIFGDEKHCRRAIDEMEGEEVRGKRVSVKLAIPPEDIRPPARRGFRGGYRGGRSRGRGYDSRYDRYGGNDRYAEPRESNGYSDYDRYDPRDSYPSRSRPKSSYQEEYRSNDEDRYPRSGGPDRSYRDRGYSSRSSPYDRSSKR